MPSSPSKASNCVRGFKIDWKSIRLGQLEVLEIGIVIFLLAKEVNKYLWCNDVQIFCHLPLLSVTEAQLLQERDMLRSKLREEVHQVKAYNAALQEAAAIIAQHNWQTALRRPDPPG